MFRSVTYFFFMLLFLSSCHRYHKVLEITHSSELKGVGSASGMSIYKDNYFVVGDDTPFLFQVDSQFQVIHKWQIYPADTTEAKLPNGVKPDFEAMENIGDSVLLIFGSGSKSPQRDILIRIHPEDPNTVETHTLTDFYRHLKNQKVLQNKELNIEGVAVRKNKMFLFNRTPAVIFELDFDTFLAYISGGPLPGVQSRAYKLPSIDGTRAGFSGVTSVAYVPYLIFTASVEVTDNSINDGAILGSFAGAILLEDDQLTSSIKTIQLNSGDKPVKVESIGIETIHSDRHMTVILVTDSDGKESMIFRCKMSW
jgi:hypothetical protein